MEAAEAEAILEVECGAPPLDGPSVAKGGGVESRPSPLLLVTSISRGREKEVVIGNGKKSPGQETGLWNRELLKVLNDTKLVLNDHE
jgi:hypothetical protein